MNGKAVRGFWGLLTSPGHLITPDAGTHEFTRLYFENTDKNNPTAAPTFNMGYGQDRIGGQRVVSGSYDFVTGLTIQLTDYLLHVPASAVKCNWKP